MRPAHTVLGAIAAVAVLGVWLATGDGSDHVQPASRPTPATLPSAAPPPRDTAIATESPPEAAAPTTAAAPTAPCKARVKQVFFSTHPDGTPYFSSFGGGTGRLCGSTAAMRVPDLLRNGIVGYRPTAKLNPERFHDALVVPLETCFANLWHGTVDFVLPLIDTMLRAGIIDLVVPLRPKQGDVTGQFVVKWRRERPLLFVVVPREAREFWGVASQGCPAMRNPPYGFLKTTNSTPTAWMVRRLSREVRFLDNEDTAYTLLNPHVKTQLQPQYGIDRLWYGLYQACRHHPWLTHWPFHVTESGAIGDEAQHCVKTQRLLRTLLGVTRKLPATHLGEAAPLRVVLIERLVVRKRGGRSLTNADAVRAAVEQALSDVEGSAQFTAVHLELMPIDKQRELIAAADVLVAVRGSASMFASMLQPTTAFVSLFPYKRATPVTAAADNFPWWPLPFLRDDVAVRFVPCEAVVPANATEADALPCRERSVNFCDMTCGRAAVRDAVASALRAVRTQTITAEMPRRKCADAECHYVLDP